jgi:predicted nucleic acid-binding protein
VANYYFDSSGLVKRYVPSEVGSAWVVSLIDPAAHLLLAGQLALVEVAAAFARKEREGAITGADRLNYLRLFARDCRAQYHLLPPTEDILRLAAELTHRQALRAYDAVQLATALQANQLLIAGGGTPLMFISADGRLCKAALAEGLTTDNPPDHP